MHRHAAVAAKDRERDLSSAQARAAVQQQGFAREIGCPRTDVATDRQGICAGHEQVAIACGVFLDQDGVGPRRHRRSSKDAQGRSCRNRRGRRTAGCAFARHAPRPRMLGRAHGITIHRRQIGPGLVAQGNQILRQPAADSLADRHRLRRQRLCKSEQAGLRLCDRQQAHSGRRQSPDLPPVFAISLTSRMTIALSSALAMS